MDSPEVVREREREREREISLLSMTPTCAGAIYASEVANSDSASFDEEESNQGCDNASLGKVLQCSCHAPLAKRAHFLILTVSLRECFIHLGERHVFICDHCSIRSEFVYVTVRQAIH